MAVTFAEPSYLAPGQWLISWSSSFGAGAHFWIYLNGELVEEDTPTTSMVVAMTTPGDLTELEVLDAAPESLDPAYPSRAHLGWYGVDGAASYRVEEYVGAAWTERKPLNAEDADFFVFRTRVLEDSTVHQWRVVPVGANGNEGTPLTWSFLMVRRPDPPDVTFSYDEGTGEVTVASA